MQLGIKFQPKALLNIVSDRLLEVSEYPARGRSHQRLPGFHCTTSHLTRRHSSACLECPFRKNEFPRCSQYRQLYLPRAHYVADAAVYQKRIQKSAERSESQ